MVRFAANISTMFREWSFLDRLDAAAAAGFSLVECQFPYEVPAEKIAGRLRRNELTMVMFNTPRGDAAAGEFGLAAMSERLADVKTSVRTAAAYAELLGVQRIHLLGGRPPTSDARAAKAYRYAVAWSAEWLAQRSVGLLIEPLNPVDNPGYVLTDFSVAEHLITDLGFTNLRLQLDTYHVRMIGGAPTEYLKRYLPIIGHIQCSSIAGRGEPDGNDVDFLKGLDASGYSGAVGCEYTPRAGTLEGLGWMRDFRPP